MARLDEAARMKHGQTIRPIHHPDCFFAGFQFLPEVVLLAVNFADFPHCCRNNQCSNGEMYEGKDWPWSEVREPR